MTVISLIIPLGLALNFNTAAWASDPPVPQIGVLRILDVKPNTGIGGRGPEIKPLFSKRNGQWDAGTSGIKNWNIILDGKVVGNIAADRPSDVKIKPVNIEFWSWDGTFIHKGFALVNHGYADDPNRWKPWKSSPNDLNLRRSAFVKLIGRDSAVERQHFRCPGFSDLKNPKKAPPKKCPDVDKVQLRRAYVDKNGTLIAQFLIETDKDGEMEDSTENISKWVTYKGSQSAPKFLFPEEQDLWDAYLIEAADFDHSGESKLLFEVSGYNLKGFYLFDSNLKKLAEEIESYH